MVNATVAPEGIYTTADGQEYLYNVGDISWVLTSSALVFIMIPGLGFFYSGLLRKRSALSMIWMSMAVFAVVFFEWFFWGFSLAFSKTGSPFIGNLDHFGFMGVDIGPSTGSDFMPQLVYAFYQAMFACITPVIACGAFADRARLGPVLLFAFCWATIVYNPLACWTWNLSSGWLASLGALDFAGGTPVHISSGTAAFAISLFLGRRKGYGTDALAYRPHNVANVILGTVFLFFGWFGFNGGSALGANLRAAMASTVTALSASVAGLTWMLLDWRLERKWSAVGLCSGIISGLVAITPASGYVGAPAAVAIGFVGAVCCNFATSFKGLVGVDDALDIFAAHGVGGFVGDILTAFFADSRVASFDGSDPIDGGWINRNWIQLGYQLADATAGMAYSFVVTLILLFLIDRIPGCHFRASEEAEVIGVDLDQIGEEAIVFPANHSPYSDDVERAESNTPHGSTYKADEKPSAQPQGEVVAA
ncbi:putative high affinity ammonium transporter [Ceraceosorus guamensis]|uniref:Ammonium transporter n=1 Tax=Ceraceosorus guamensis TaxID=1522189 RepID=A0A316W5P0_9BASI|nr:putative high affinity ammonium transporter [Ceraceosorus guamensis]PWN45187.1 putative high affinity ammonium transporter [Ceraceosorus guamensis]